MSPGNAIAVATAARASAAEKSVSDPAPLKEEIPSVPSDGVLDEATPVLPSVHDAKDVEMRDEERPPSVPSDLDSKESSPGLPSLDEAKDDVNMNEVPPSGPSNLIEDELVGPSPKKAKDDDEENHKENLGEAGDASAPAAETAAAGLQEAAAGDAVDGGAAPAAPEAAAAEEEQCLICYDTLFVKRAVTCVPCMHSMHRTCAIGWLETRTDDRAQFCANCRSPVEMIADMETGEELQAVAAYGAAGHPTRALIDNVYQRGHDEWLASHLAGEMERTMRTISQLEEARRISQVIGKGKEYVDDIDEESTKLMHRYSILDGLDAEWAAIRRAQYEAEREAEEAARAAREARAAAAAAAAHAAAEAAAPQAALAAVVDAVVAATDGAAEAAEAAPAAAADPQEEDPLEQMEIVEQPTAAVPVAGEEVVEQPTEAPPAAAAEEVVDQIPLD